MTHQLMVTVNKTTDVVITKDGQLAVSRPNSQKPEDTFIIGPLKDSTIEGMIYALNQMRIHT